jgi:predicted aspartyl protease
MRGRVRCIVVLLLLIFAAVLPAQAEKRPFRLAGGQVVFDITIKGTVVPALMDTGATRSLIEVGLAKELGIGLYRTGTAGNGGTVGVTGGRIDSGQTRQVPVDIGVGQKWTYIGTYPEGASFADADVRVLIGMDMLNDLVVSLDFATMTVDLQRHSDFKRPAGEPLKLTLTGWYRPTLRVELAGAPAELLLDTAASVALHLDAAFVAKTPVLKALPVSARRITGVDGVRDHDAIVVPEVTLGGERFVDVRASVGSLAALRASDHMDGVMGVGLLKHFHVVMDFARNEVWLTRHTDE